MRPRDGSAPAPDDLRDAERPRDRLATLDEVVERHLGWPTDG
jgi:hypothetical protein